MVHVELAEAEALRLVAHLRRAEVLLTRAAERAPDVEETFACRQVRIGLGSVAERIEQAMGRAR